MAISVTFRVIDGGKVALKWAGNDGGVTVYRTSNYDSTYAGKTDWTSEETLGALITTGEFTDDSPLTNNYYYVTDGTAWGTCGVAPANYAPALDPAYQAASIGKVTASDAYRNAINNGGSVKFDPLPIAYQNGENGIAIVALVGDPAALDEQGIGIVLSELGCKFNILQTGTVQNFTGYEAKLSGATKIQYTAKTVS